MEIDFYGSKLCPRCRKTKKHLNELKKDYPELQINFIEVTTAPVQTLKNRIFMIPALKTQRQRLSAVFLSRKQIEQFLQHEQQLAKQQ